MKCFFQTVIFAFISIFFYLSCTAQHVKIQDSKDKRIIDLDLAKKMETLFLHSTLYKSVKIIPLETNKSCLIGLINKLQVTDNFILVLDRSKANSLYVFNKEGHFVRKIGRVGQGPGEYISIADFTVDRENGIVYISDGRLPRIHKYDLTTGKFIQTIMFRFNNGRANFKEIEHIGGNLYANALFLNHSPKNYLLFSIDESSGKEKNNFLNVMEYNKGFSNIYVNQSPYRVFFSRENGNTIYVQAFMKQIIEISKEGVFSFLELRGKNMLTNDEAKQVYESFPKNILETNNRINKYCRSLADYVENKEMIYMFLYIGRNTLHMILINKNTNEVCVFDNYFNDMLYGNRNVGRSFVLGCADNQGAYYHTSDFFSNGISDLQKNYKAGLLSPDVIGLEKLMKLSDEDNPVLLYYEFKD